MNNVQLTAARTPLFIGMIFLDEQGAAVPNLAVHENPSTNVGLAGSCRQSLI
jgi:hypothetical protein